MSTQKKKRGLAAWTTRDILVTAAIAIVFALLLTGMNYVLVAVTPFGPLAIQAISGLWVIPGVITAYILRRPGAALISQLLVGVIQAPLSPYGWMTVIGQLTYGLASEAVFLATRYRNYRLPVLLIVGSVTNLVNMALVYVPLGYTRLSAGMQIAVVALTLLSGALGGWLAKGLADAIAQTGVLSGFAIGQEGREI